MWRSGRELVALVTFRDSHLPGGNVSIQRKQLFTSSHPQKTLLPTQYLGCTILFIEHQFEWALSVA